MVELAHEFDEQKVDGSDDEVQPSQVEIGVLVFDLSAHGGGDGLFCIVVVYLVSQKFELKFFDFKVVDLDLSALNLEMRVDFACTDPFEIAGRNMTDGVSM